jgi:hypothetical protein
MLFQQCVESIINKIGIEFQFVLFINGISSMRKTVKKVLLKIINLMIIFYFPSVLSAFSAAMLFLKKYPISDLIGCSFFGPFYPILIAFLFGPYAPMLLILLFMVVLISCVVVGIGLNYKQNKIIKNICYSVVSLIWAITTFLTIFLISFF